MTKEKDIKTVVPTLRFPEFRDTEEWEVLYGCNVFDQISNKNHNSDLPILAISQEYGAIPRDMIDYNVVVTDKSIESYKVVDIDDFIISLRSFQGGIEYSSYQGLCSPAYIVLRKKIDINNQFFKYYFKSYMFIQDLNKNLEGIRDGKMISYKQFSEILLPVPIPSEQKKIANCLDSLDNLINAVANKIETLKEYKKGLMQQLFPAEGKTIPAFRFPEFQNAGEWKETILESLCNSIASGKNKNNPNGDYDLYGSTGIIGKTDFGDYNGTYILVARVGAHAGFLTKVDGKFGVTDNTLVINLKLCVVVDFVYYLLNNLGLNNLVFGSGQPLITGSQLKNLEITIPSPIEQQKIADCLSSVDELISTETNKLDQLKAHKKGLMQQLFPTINE